MAYTAADHQVFSARCRNLMLSMQGAREEAARLLAIYTNESVSGSDPDFDDTDIATKSEHQDVMTFVSDFDKFWTNQAVAALDRQTWITPFIQVP